MGLAAQFETIIHKQLNVHASWLPITVPYKLGDYGFISDGVFQKIGNIAEFNATFTQATGNDAALNFTSDSVTAIDSSAGAGVSVDPGIEIKASLTFKFNSDRSFLVKAPIINVVQIENVNQLVGQLKQVADWRRKFVVVYQVYTAQNPLIISNVTSGTEVTISGDGTAPKPFNVGNASAKFGLKTNRELGLELTGQTGPIALGLFKLNWLSGNLSILDNDDEEVEVIDLNGESLTDTV